MRVLDRFRERELQRIKDAVGQAEQRTSGEIVTYIVGECDAYPEAAWRAATLGALSGMGLGFAGQHYQDLIAAPLWVATLWWVLIPTVLGALLGLLLGSKVDAVRRRLVRPDILAHRVGLRAESAFLEEQVFETRERTGILLFVALFEHRVVVLGDEGINARVEEGEWSAIVEHMIADLKDSGPAEAVLRGVEDCGLLLERHGVVRRADDTDELDNQPRLRDR